MDAQVQLSRNGGSPALPAARSAPPTVSAREHLRRGVPDVYRREGAARGVPGASFTMRFLQALEEVLDPIVATLDSLPAYFDIDLAPEHALAGLATWLGVDEVESLPADQRREAVRRAGELGRLRGTRAGLQLALSLFFPDITARINDHGSVVVSDTVEGQPPLTAASFDVVCDQPLAPEMQMAVARCIERWKPVHAHYKLRVRRGDKVKTLPDVPAASPEGVTPPELRPPFVDPVDLIAPSDPADPDEPDAPDEPDDLPGPADEDEP